MDVQGILVSVIMSVYNDEDYVEQAVRSILEQTHSNIEFIIIDDASTDNSVEVIKKCMDERVKLFLNSINMKLAHNLNQGIRMAKGKYIARMDADDIALPFRLEKQVKYLEKHKEIDILGTYVKVFGSEDGIMKYPKKHNEIVAGLLFSNVFCHPSIIFRNLGEKIVYNEKCIAGQDYELWARMSDKAVMHNIPKVLLSYRVHEKQTKNLLASAQKEGEIRGKRIMLDYFREVLDETDKSDFCKLSYRNACLNRPQLVVYRNMLSRMLKYNDSVQFVDKKTFRIRIEKEMQMKYYLALKSKTISGKEFWILNKFVQMLRYDFTRIPKIVYFSLKK